MSYSTGEALILAKVQAVTGFDTTNAVRSNWKLLNKGKASHYAIVRPADEASPITWLSWGVYQVEWLTTIEVWQRYTDEGTTQTNLYGYVNAIIAALQLSRRYGDTTGNVLNASIHSIGQPREMWTKGGGPAWLRQDITVSIKELTEVTFTN